jgi:hypothetical protein
MLHTATLHTATLHTAALHTAALHTAALHTAALSSGHVCGACAGKHNRFVFLLSARTCARVA